MTTNTIICLFCVEMVFIVFIVPNGGHRGAVRRHEGVRAALHVGAGAAALARAATPAAPAPPHHALQVPGRSAKAAQLPQGAAQNYGCQTRGWDLIMQYAPTRPLEVSTRDARLRSDFILFSKTDSQ
uniref:Uncharacterized protein n=1 Tax=Pectinophora gossypiella TaxID=13191 RepID=A0A1E1WQ80_PECGO